MPDSEIHDIGSAAADAGGDRRAVDGGGPVSNRRYARMIKIGLGIAVAWFGFVAVASWLGGERAQAPTAEESAGAEAQEPTSAGGSQRGGDEGTGEPGAEADRTGAGAAAGRADESAESADSAEPEASVEGAVVFEDVGSDALERLRRQLALRQLDIGLAYESSDGVVVIDLANGQAGTASVGAVAEPVIPGDDTVSLAAGPRTYFVSPSEASVVLVADDWTIMVSDDAGAWYRIGGEDRNHPVPIVAIDGGGGVFGPAPVPRAHEPTAFPGLGVLATAKGPAGSTQIARIGGFEPLSDGRVFAANHTAVAEHLCSADSCHSQVRFLDSGDTYSIPDEFIGIDSSYRLSPDGTALLRMTGSGFAEIVRSDATTTWVATAGVNQVGWLPDSSGFVWLDLFGPPTLNVHFIDARDWVVAELEDLDVAVPASPDIVLFDVRPTASDR